MLAASFAASAGDGAATELIRLNDCLPFSIFDEERGCPSDRVTTLTRGLACNEHDRRRSVSARSAGEGRRVVHPDADTGS